MKFMFICIKLVKFVCWSFWGVCLRFFGLFFFPPKADQDLHTVKTKGKSSAYLYTCLCNTDCLMKCISQPKMKAMYIP